MRRSTAWRWVAQRIEQRQSCGPKGLCHYLILLDVPSRFPRPSMQDQLAAHMDTNRAMGSNLSPKERDDAPRSLVADRGEWRPRVLLTYFLSYEARDEEE